MMSRWTQNLYGNYFSKLPCPCVELVNQAIKVARLGSNPLSSIFSAVCQYRSFYVTLLEISGGPKIIWLLLFSLTQNDKITIQLDAVEDVITGTHIVS